MDQQQQTQPSNQSTPETSQSSSYADTRTALMQALGLGANEAPAEAPEQTEATNPPETPETPHEAPHEPPKQPYLTLKDLQEYQQLAAEKADLERRAKELEERAQIADMLKTDPLKAHELAGFSYDDITKAYLSGNKPEPKIDHHPVVVELKTQVEQMSKLLGELQRERTVTGVAGYVESTADKRPLTHRLFQGNRQKVIDVATGYMSQGLDRDQALDTIEAELKELVAFLSPGKQNEPPKTVNAQAVTRPSIPTITNEQASSVSATKTPTESYAELRKKLFGER